MLSTCPGCCHTVPAVPAPARFSCAQNDTGAEMQSFFPSFSAARFGTGLENARRQLVQPFSSTTRYTLQDHGSQPSSPTNNSWDRLWSGHSEVIEDVIFLWHSYTNESFAADWIIQELLAETRNQCQCPNLPLPCVMGLLKHGFWNLCHWLVPLMPQGELRGGTSRVQPSPVQWFQSRSVHPMRE